MMWERDSSPAPTERPTDDELMTLLRDALDEMAPPLVEGCHVRDGILVGSAGWAVMALPNHTDNPRHFDIGFVASLDGARRAVLPDCITGFGAPREAATMMVHIWRETSGACFAEMLTRNSAYASHLDGSHPAGLPGWHSVVSGVLAYGPDSDSNTALQTAMVEHDVLRTIAPSLLPGLDRPVHNGIKVFYQRTPATATAEVRINGVPHEKASRALAELHWPHVTAPTTARFYAVAVSPSQSP